MSYKYAQIPVAKWKGEEILYRRMPVDKYQWHDRIKTFYTPSVLIDSGKNYLWILKSFD